MPRQVFFSGHPAVRFAVFLAWSFIAFAPVLAQAPEGAIVRVEKVRSESMTQTVPIVGRLVATRMGDIAARISGPVESMMVDVGDRVSKGQVIAILDAEILSADLKLAESELQEANAELATWRAEQDVAATELRRQAGLQSSTAFSQARFEDAQKKVAVAEARVERARANASIKRYNLERKQLDVEYAKIRAPYSGVVMRRSTESGAYVEKGDPVIRLIGDESIEVEAFVPNSRLSGIEVGQVLKFGLDDGTTHQGKVRSILPSENPQTRTRVVRIVPEFSKVKRPLADSQSVVVAIPISSDKEVVTVHKDAILKRPNGDMVYLVNGDDVAELRPVKLGEAVGMRFAVISGLKEGDVVVTRGNERLQPGAKVRTEKGAS